MDPTARTTAMVIGLVIAGVVFGAILGSLGEDDPEVVVQTVEVTDTQTVRRTTTVTRTRTVTVDEFGDVVTTAAEDDEDCHDDYLGACVPRDADADDVSCGQIPDRDFDSIGDDPYGLDPDGDGVACET